MVASGLVHPEDVRTQFELIEPDLYRFPAIDPASFRAAVDELVPEIVERKGLERWSRGPISGPKFAAYRQ